MTITQVAEQAGVSMKTVSRVLNREPHVREEVRQRVLETARRLSYRPQISARSLAGARSYIVGYLLTDPSIAYYGHAQLGALKACREAGYHLLVESLDLDNADLAAELDSLFAAVAVDGVLLTPPLCDNPQLLDAFDRSGTLYVRISPQTTDERSSSIGIDDRAAAHEMTLCLLDLGHQDIGFVIGDPAHGAAHRRLEGFRQAMAERGRPVRRGLVRQGRFDFASGVRAGTALLDLKSPPTAVFASNDAMALGVMAAAQRRGLAIPKDLSVAGFDDIALAAITFPPLTTVRQPITEMATAATRIIIEQGRRDSASPRIVHRTLPCELVTRESTAPPRPGLLRVSPAVP